MKKIKEKSGSIAIPFLLTFLISLIIIGGIAMIIYDKIDSDSSSLLTMSAESGTLTDGDSHTVLMILDLSDSADAADEEESSEDEEYTDEDEDSGNEDSYDWEDDAEDEKKAVEASPYTFMLMRSAPVHKQITFIGLPDNMLAGQQNKPVSEIYKSGGAAEVRAAAEFSLEVPIDRYMVFDSKAFRKLCNIMGGVNFAVPGEIEGFKKSDGLQYLSPEQIEKIISYGGFGGGEIQRISTAASLITAMTNQTSGMRIAENLDNTFKTIINLVETDITAMDFQEKKYAVKFLMKYTDPEDNESTSGRAKFITPFGTKSGDSFIVDSEFLRELSQYFVVETTQPQTETSLQPMEPETEVNSNE